ncbi:MAG: pimB 5 [Solirubrobacteraceae bacterium]|nr:pimB 5 [Solirubrobacteraceae bacterium]
MGAAGEVAALISVVVRTKDEEASIGRTLELLAGQRIEEDVEVIVVDSGSGDRTVEIARAGGARVIEIAAERFTFGGAMNIGTTAARGELIVALSAHAFPPDERWLSRLVANFADERVCCVAAGLADPSGRPLDGPCSAGAEALRDQPDWGYSNAEGAFRRELWAAYPFRWDMPGTEDKEWAWYWAQRGWSVVVDPSVMTDHDHTGDTVRQNYQRWEREWRGFAMYLDVERWGAREVVDRWLHDAAGWPALWRARVAPRRLARLAGDWRGRRYRRPRPADVAVFVDRFPELSETFIVQEARALRRLGHRVVIRAGQRAERPGPGAGDGVPVRWAAEEAFAERARATAWLVARHPLACLRDRRGRDGWATEEAVVPLRRLAVRAYALSRLRDVHLHAHFAAGAALDALRIGALLGRTVSVTAHAYDIYLHPANLRRKLLEPAFATSGCDYTVDHLRGIVGPERADRVLKVVMGVDGSEFERRTELPGGRHVVAVGRLVEKKGFGVLVDAVAACDDVTLTIAGAGPLREDLQARIDAAGAQDRIRLAGAMTPQEIRALLERADLLAMPCVIAADGDRDSMPVVVKEAMAMELPVVASREVGLPEIVREPWGRLVAPGDADALRDAILEVLALTSEERGTAGRAGRAFVLSHGNVDDEAAKLATFIAAGPVP